MPFTRMAIPLRSIATGEGNVKRAEKDFTYRACVLMGEVAERLELAADATFCRARAAKLRKGVSPHY